MNKYKDIVNHYNSITVVMVIKDRDGMRVKKCLESLKNQTKPCEVILVDYGSNPSNLSWERELIKEFPAVKFIEVTKNTEVFNKCRALNIGFKASDTKYVLSSDIDIIFAPNFIEEVMNVFKDKPNSIVLCQKIDLDEEGKEIEFHEPSASGSCIAISSDWIDKVHGYDEYYTYWGREDNDLVDRAIQDGFEVVWITDKTKIYHQWHEPAIQTSLEENDWYYRKGNKPIERNPNGWGEI
jgi:GT2 family glycosyltransferase